MFPNLDADIRAALLIQLRDLWTHTSTAIEGNSLTLGETAFVLREGLTIAGKPLKDHQDVVGHARAIALSGYQNTARKLSLSSCGQQAQEKEDQRLEQLNLFE